MAHSNGMGFWRRMNYGMYRPSWRSQRVLRNKEAETEIREELEPGEVCSKCGSPDHKNEDD